MLVIFMCSYYMDVNEGSSDGFESLVHAWYEECAQGMEHP